MVEQTKEEEEGQQPDSGRITTTGRGRQIMATLLGHTDHNRSGRQDLHRAHTVVMEYTERHII